MKKVLEIKSGNSYPSWYNHWMPPIALFKLVKIVIFSCISSIKIIKFLKWYISKASGLWATVLHCFLIPCLLSILFFPSEPLHEEQGESLNVGKDFCSFLPVKKEFFQGRQCRDKVTLPLCVSFPISTGRTPITQRSLLYSTREDARERHTLIPLKVGGLGRLEEAEQEDRQGRPCRPGCCNWAHCPSKCGGGDRVQPPTTWQRARGSASDNLAPFPIVVLAAPETSSRREDTSMISWPWHSSTTRHRETGRSQMGLRTHCHPSLPHPLTTVVPRDPSDPSTVKAPITLVTQMIAPTMALEPADLLKSKST